MTRWLFVVTLDIQGRTVMANFSLLELQKYFQQVDYPTNKEHLIAHASQQGANEKVLSVLSKLTDKTYLTPGEVSQALTAQ
ncbi:MAG TPA: DUF2795 domain-containing protein [Phormidium sp.]